MVKSLIDVETQIGVFKKYKEDIFQQNGKPKPCTDKIYAKLMTELKGMTSKAIQVSIIGNIKSILKVVSNHKITVNSDFKIFLCVFRMIKFHPCPTFNLNLSILMTIPFLK